MLAQHDRDALRAWLEDTGMPDDSIARILELAAVAMELLPEVDEAGAMALLYFGESNLRRIWGVNFDARFAAAIRMLEEVEQRKPGLFKFIHSHPQIFNNPAVAGRIALHAERRHSN